ncbi:hypothetical protein [Providencia rettgeri]|uniref:hypothetical protein n=1 Tax=Providencia rettgeri TaxID=587 RepID=UPI00235DF9A7|nr:hypothetical protein [Providencia rettgeri]
MLQREAIEAVMMELAHQQGQSLNGRNRLVIRTGVSQTIQTKERHRRRMTAPPTNGRSQHRNDNRLP